MKNRSERYHSSTLGNLTQQSSLQRDSFLRSYPVDTANHRLTILLLYFQQKQMASHLGKRKVLKVITQQENNATLHNKHSLITTPNNKSKQLLQLKHVSEQKTKEKAIEYQSAQRTEHKQEKGEQSCQNYFLRKTVMALYRLFQRTQSRWELQQLEYWQLLRVMCELGYVREGGKAQDLKRCYWLWLNLSQGRSFSLTNLLIALFCLEHLHYDPHLIQDIINELSKGIAKFPLQNTHNHDHFIFLVKNEKFPIVDGLLQLQQHDVEKIQTTLKELRLNKLMQNSHLEEREEEEQQRCAPISKRSEQLAENKRQKIRQAIRQSEPHVQEIQLHHILTYKPAKCTAREPNLTQRSNRGTKKATSHAPSEAYSYLLEATHTKGRPIPAKPTLPEKEEKIMTEVFHEEEGDIKKYSKIQSRESQQSFDFCPSEELFTANQGRQRIVEELEWEEIPRPAEEVRLQREVLQQEAGLEPPLTHAFKKGDGGQRQRKRKEYIQLPILFVDVNIEEGRKERIVIYEGDQASDLAHEFAIKHGLPADMVERLEGLLELQIGSILTKIEEANEQDCSELY